MDVIIDGVRYILAPFSQQPGADPVVALPGQSPADRMRAALDLRFSSRSRAGDDLTIREYFGQLMSAVWREEQGFDGKRPFGESGWQWVIYEALVDGKFIGGHYAGGLEGLILYDRDDANRFILGMIAIMATEPFK